MVLFTPSLQDSSVTSWHHGDARTVAFQNGTLLVRDSMAPLRAASRGGVVVTRSHDGPLGSDRTAAGQYVDRASLQNLGASAILGRAVVAWHGLAAQPGDVILHTRPDMVFEFPIDGRTLHSLFQAATSAGVPPLLLLPESDTIIGSNDPFNDHFFLSREALDRLCPAGCQHTNAIGCGGIWRNRVLTHLGQRRGVAGFFLRPGAFPVRLLRMNGRCSWYGSNNLPCFASKTNSSVAIDVTGGLRCVVGENALNQSACHGSTPHVTHTRWGPALNALGFNFGARYFVCLRPLDGAALGRRAFAVRTTRFS